MIQIGVHFRNVQFSGNAINISMTCPYCGMMFDAAGPGEVRISSGPDGGLRVLRSIRTATRQVLAEKPTVEELSALVESLREAVEGRTSVEDAVARVQSFPRLEAWIRNNPAAAKMLGALLVIILTALATRAVAADPAPTPAPRVDVHVQQPSDEELQQLIEEAIRQAEQEQQARAAEPGTPG